MGARTQPGKRCPIRKHGWTYLSRVQRDRHQSGEICSYTRLFAQGADRRGGCGPASFLWVWTPERYRCLMVSEPHDGLVKPPPAPLAAPAAPPGRATMRDVAKLAGVSLKTVSRVVNGAPTVDAELADRVRRSVAQLNYRHNLTASNLRRGDRRSFMIGLMLEDVSNPYSAGIYRAVEDVARDRGVGLRAASLDENPERERELAASLVARRVDGLIIAPAGRDQSYLRNEQAMGVAVGFVDP